MIYHNNYENMNLPQILEDFSHYQQVNFALYCAKEVESFTNDQRVIYCNLVLQRWLKGDQSVDLFTAKNNAWDAVSYASVIANASYYASSASYYTAAVIDNAFYSYYGCSSAWRASRAKSYNLCPNNRKQREIAHKQFYNEYEQIAQNWLSHWTIPNFPKDESDFPIFDYLQDYNLISYLLPKKENYYYLNLNGFTIKHENEAELLKLIDTIHIKQIIRKIINNDSAQQL